MRVTMLKATRAVHVGFAAVLVLALSSIPSPAKAVGAAKYYPQYALEGTDCQKFDCSGEDCDCPGADCTKTSQTDQSANQLLCGQTDNPPALVKDDPTSQAAELKVSDKKVASFKFFSAPLEGPLTPGESGWTAKLNMCRLGSGGEKDHTVTVELRKGEGGTTDPLASVPVASTQADVKIRACPAWDEFSFDSFDVEPANRVFKKGDRMLLVIRVVAKGNWRLRLMDQSYIAFPEPAAIALVLDDTGSMHQPSGDVGLTKIQALRDVVEAFAAIVDEFVAKERKGFGDEAGAISFKVPPGGDPSLACPPEQVGPWTDELAAMKTLDTTNAQTAAIVSATNTSMPADGDATPLRSGIVAGSEMLQAVSKRRIMLLLTDGKENTWGCKVAAMPTFKQEHLDAYGIELLTVGYGTGGQVNAGLLESLDPTACITGGGMSTFLKKCFIPKFETVLDVDTSVDPFGVIGLGGVDHEPFVLSGVDRTALAVLMWTHRGVELDLELFGPESTHVTSDDAADPASGVSVVAGPTYKTLVLRFPLGGPLRAAHVGEWKASISHKGGGAGERERYVFAVLMDSPLDFDVTLPSEPRVGSDPFPILATLTGPVGAVTTVEGDLVRPAESLGELLADVGLTDPEILQELRSNDYTDVIDSNQKDLDMLARRFAVLQGKRGLDPVKKKTEHLTFVDDGKHGDGKAGDGVFGAYADPLRLDGEYAVLVRAAGQTTAQDAFQRESRRTFHVPFVVSAKESTVTVTPTPGSNATDYTLVVTPRDANGLRLGPGRAAAISAEGVGATIDPTVEDRGDGTYALAATVEPGARRARVTVEAKDEPLPPVTLKRGFFDWLIRFWERILALFG